MLNFSGVLNYNKNYNLTELKLAVSSALETFRDNFEFNGVFYSNDLETYIKNTVAGVRNFYAGATSLDGVTFTNSVILSSAYFNYATGIENNISYVAV